MLVRIISIVIGYLFGLIQTGYILGKIYHFDLNKEGSGNVGATNALRSEGKKIAIITLLGDMFKAIIPMIIFPIIFAPLLPNARLLISLYIGLGVVLGHTFPILPFEKGGKGVSSILGVALASMPAMAVIPLTSFIIIVVATKTVSLGSIIAATLFSIQGFIFHFLGLFNVSSKYSLECAILYLIISLIVIFKHRENIKRLINGQENKI